MPIVASTPVRLRRAISKASLTILSFKAADKLFELLILKPYYIKLLAALLLPDMRLSRRFFVRQLLLDLLPRLVAYLIRLNRHRHYFLAL